MPLLDLRNLKKVLNYITEAGKEEILINYGKISTSTIVTILRKMIELEPQVADLLFGETSFGINDFIRFDEN